LTRERRHNDLAFQRVSIYQDAGMSKTGQSNQAQCSANAGLSEVADS